MPFANRSLARLLCVFLLIPFNAVPCAWDRDTLRKEVEGRESVFDVIVGRFERNPPLYYEMRLERVAAEIAKDATLFDAYDDASVACDRLGRSDEAIEWMGRKLAALNAMRNENADDSTPRYRYHANLGTFYAHRWFRSGASYNDLGDMRSAIFHIKKALAINPDAHFGREKYQLQLLKWVESKPRIVTENLRPDFEVAYYLTFLETAWMDGEADWDRVEKHWPALTNHDQRKDAIGEEAVEGVAGLVALGAAWESVDVFLALSRALRSPGDNTLGYMAYLRAQELVGQGKDSMLRNEMEWEPFLDNFRYESSAMFYPDADTRDDHEGEFARHRENAEQWHEHRTEFMMAKLKEGLHPDTHDDFWNDYSEIRRLRPTNWTIEKKRKLWARVWLAIPSGFLVLLCGYTLWWRYKKKRGAASLNV